MINVTDQGKLSFKKYGQKACTFCGKTGHTIDTCYHKHGVPPHLQRNSNSNAHNIATDNLEILSSETHNDPDIHSPPQLTAEHYQTLMFILHNSNISRQLSTSNQVRTFHFAADTGNISTSVCLHNSTLSSWIIDAGASDHICGALHWFKSL